MKFDIASRHGKSFLGINVQFIQNKKIQLRTLSIKLLEERHTAEYLNTVLKETLERYEVPITNVYTCTSDNGANMVKLTKLLRDDQDQCLAENYEEDDDENLEDVVSVDETSDSNDSSSQVEEDEYLLAANSIGVMEKEKEKEEGVEKFVEDEDGTPEGAVDEEGLLILVRCAAHTLQLCVWDIMKKRMDKVIPRVNAS